MKLMKMEFDGSFIVSRIDDKKLISTDKRMEMMTVHCQKCNTVVADSFGVCGEMKSVDSIMCIKVTNDVVVGAAAAQDSGHKVKISNCIYSPLKCRSCHSVVGKVIHSAPSHWASLRSIFLLCKANVCCYILNSGSMVKASALSFDLKPLEENMTEVRLQVEEQLAQMKLVHSRVTDQSVTSDVYE